MDYCDAEKVPKWRNLCLLAKEAEYLRMFGEPYRRRKEGNSPIITTTKSDDDTSGLDLLADVTAMLYDESQRVKKGKSKIVYEEEEDERVKSFFDIHVPRKGRSSLKKSDDGASTSSLLLHLNKKNLVGSEPSSSVVESRKMKRRNPRPWDDYYTETQNPPNPSSQSSLSSYVSRKRRALKQKRRLSGNSKKPKADYLSWDGRDIPQSLLDVMRRMNVFEEPKLIFEKGLDDTDVSTGQGRLSMPKSQIMYEKFLTPSEWTILKNDINNATKSGFKAILVNEKGRQWNVVLKRWESKNSWNYVLTCGWNRIVEDIGLQQDSGISIWTFRSHGFLYFALIPLLKKGHQ